MFADILKKSSTIQAFAWLGRQWREPTNWRSSRWWMRDDATAIRMSLLRILALSHRNKIDVGTLVQQLAQEHRGLARLRLNRLAHRLLSNTPLVEALEQTPHLLTDQDVLSLRFATQSGTLESAYSELLRASPTGRNSVRVRTRQSLAYAISMSLVMFFLISMLMVFIAPTMLQIFDEFGLEVPTSFIALTQVCGAVARYLPLFVAGVILAFAFMWTARPGRWLGRRLASRTVPFIYQLRIAHLLQMLSHAAAAGRPLAGSLSTLARFHFDKNVRHKLLFARNEVEQGAEPWQSLATSNLVTAKESDALRNADDKNLRPWLMKQMAAWKEERIQFRLRWGAALIHPILVLLFGAIVCWVTTSFFSLLQQMIWSLA